MLTAMFIHQLTHVLAKTNEQLINLSVASGPRTNGMKKLSGLQARYSDEESIEDSDDLIRYSDYRAYAERFDWLAKT